MCDEVRAPRKNIFTRWKILMTLGWVTSIVITAVIARMTVNSGGTGGTVVCGGTNQTTEGRGTNRTVEGRNIMETHNDSFSQILNQLEELKKLGCHPTQVKVPTRDALSQSDDDFTHIYPEWVLTSRCLEECSFCQQAQELCLPVPEENKINTVIVAYEGYDNVTGFRQLQVVEHTSCRCQQQ